MTDGFRSPVVLLFARAPEPGRVKTRLAARLGAEAAAAAHRACLLDAMRLAGAVRGCRPRLLLAGETGRLAEQGIVLPRGWRVERQRGRGLGERMARAFAESFRQGAGKVVAIGTDTPWMGRQRIEMAFAWLERDDVTLGPSADGGYYLIGLRRPMPELFRGIAWGRRNVLAQTRWAGDRIGASCRLLPWDFDLDRPGDLDRARELLRRQPERAPELAAWLSGMNDARGPAAQRPAQS